MSKRIIRCLLYGVIYGVTLVAIMILLGLSDEQIWKLYFGSAVIILVGSMLINICYQLHFQKKVINLIPLLQNGNIDTYVAEMENIEKKVRRTKKLHAFVLLNLTAGYLEQKKSEKAQNILLELENANLKEELEAVRIINLCFSYLYQEKSEEFYNLHKEKKEFLSSFKDSKNLGGTVNILNIIALIYEGKNDEAQSKLIEAKNVWQGEDYQKHYNIIEKYLISSTME